MSSLLSRLLGFKIVDDIVQDIVDNVYEQPNDEVFDVRPEHYALRDIHSREDSLVLYKISDTLYEIVLFKGFNTLLSICRVNEESLAVQYYTSLSDKLPKLAAVSPKSLTRDSLKRILDYVRENPNQNLVHVSAHFGFIKCLKQLSGSDVDLVDARCADTGLTPLHVAVKSGRLSSVRALLGLSPQLDVCDNEGNNVLHMAANTDADIVRCICLAIQFRTDANKSELINAKNKDGFSPLFLACLNHRRDCVQELALNGADPKLDPELLRNTSLE